MKITILDDYQDAVRTLDCFRLLEGHEVTVLTETHGPDRLAHLLADQDAVVLIRERSAISAQLLDRLPRLRLISQTGKVSGHVDVEAATARGVVIVEGTGDPTAPAELTWALIMAATRRIPQYVAHLKAGRWQTASLVPAYNQLGRSLKGDTLGIWGYGKIGRLVAGYGKAFGMDVVVWGRDASREQATRDGHRAAASRQAFFTEADILSLHLRLNEATRGIVTADDLAAMKPTALFVNTSRAELVADAALQAALAQGRPGQAAIDVFETEPLPADSPLLQADNVLATPHLGYVDKKGYELYFGAALRNIVDFCNGTPKNVLNPTAIGRA